MEESLIQTYYLNVEGEIEGLRCPKCGLCYMTEEIATGRLARAEKSVESK